MQTKTLFVSALLLLGASATQAKIKMFPLFTDNMVLQQNTKAPIWGEAKAGRNVKRYNVMEQPHIHRQGRQ